MSDKRRAGLVFSYHSSLITHHFFSLPPFRIKHMMDGVGRPVGEAACDGVGAGFAQSLLGDGVGDAKRAHAGAARRLYAGRRVLDDEALVVAERDDVRLAAPVVEEVEPFAVAGG